MKPISEIERRILDVLVFEGKLLKTPFEINEDLIIQYMHAYVSVMKKTSFKLKLSDYKHSRKLAALTLLKYYQEIGGVLTDQPTGFVYVISNPVYPDCVKIGMTLDVESRLKSYQTYDPLRRFKVLKYDFVMDRRLTEKKILQNLHIDLVEGEWVKAFRVEEIFKNLTYTYPVVYAD